jgi:hypothetical protein
MLCGESDYAASTRRSRSQIATLAKARLAEQEASHQHPSRKVRLIRGFDVAMVAMPSVSAQHGAHNSYTLVRVGNPHEALIDLDLVERNLRR